MLRRGRRGWVRHGIGKVVCVAAGEVTRGMLRYVLVA